MLVSSHLLSEIEKMATDLTIINHGKLVFQGSQDELYSAQLPDVFIQTPDAATAVSVLRALQPKRVEGGVELSGLDDDHLAHTIALLVTHGVPLHQVLRKRRSLEDIFIGLTNDEVADA